MKKDLVERNMVVVLFILVMVVFSFAERDTKKLFQHYNSKNITEIGTTPVPLISHTTAFHQSEN